MVKRRVPILLLGHLFLMVLVMLGGAFAIFAYPVVRPAPLALIIPLLISAGYGMAFMHHPSLARHRIMVINLLIPNAFMACLFLALSPFWPMSVSPRQLLAYLGGIIVWSALLNVRSIKSYAEDTAAEMRPGTGLRAAGAR